MFCIIHNWRSPPAGCEELVLLVPVHLCLWDCLHTFTSLDPSRFPRVFSVVSSSRFCLLSSCVTFKFTRNSEKQHSSHQRALLLPSRSHSLIHTEMDKSSGTDRFLSFLDTSARCDLWSSYTEAHVCEVYTSFICIQLTFFIFIFLVSSQQRLVMFHIFYFLDLKYMWREL